MSIFQHDCGPEVDRLLKKIATAYDLAEQTIKDFELDEILDAPAINQLRYTGRHLIDSFSCENCDQLKETLFSAYDNTKRAINDAYDARLIYYLDEARKFQEDYSDFPIINVLQDYTEHRQILRDARNQITGDEEVFAKFYLGRDGLDKLIEKKDIVLGARDVVDRFEDARPAINDIVLKENQEIIRFEQNKNISKNRLTVAIIALIITLLVFIFTDVLKFDKIDISPEPVIPEEIIDQNDSQSEDLEDN